MRECRTYGSVRGAPGNGRPYRDSERVWLAGSAGFSYYVGRFPSYNATFGVLGGKRSAEALYGAA